MLPWFFIWKDLSRNAMRIHTINKIRKWSAGFLAIALIACLLAACGGESSSNSNNSSGSGGNSSANQTNLKGEPAEILKQIMEEAAKALPDDKPMPGSFDGEVTADTSQNTIGLSTADFNQYVSSATVSTAAISTFAHQVSLILAKDAASAAEIKKRIAGDGGFDSQKWICVWPEESCVIDSGSYVLLVVSRADVAEAVVAAFTAAAGNVGERVVFFTSEAGAGGGGGGLAIGGGMGISIGGEAPKPN